MHMPISSDSLTDSIVDVLIVGAGPAGLAAANHPSLKRHSILVVESGSDVNSRDRYNPHHVTCGDGGAGLFSDGKFSFFPSASALWQIDDQRMLKRAYSWTSRVLASAGMAVPPFPSNAAAEEGAHGDWHLKSYPSQYLSLDARYALVRSLVGKVPGPLLHNTTVVAAHFLQAKDVFIVTLLDSVANTHRIVHTRSIIFAGGRFAPTTMNTMPFIKPIFRRLEVGFRIQQPARSAFFAECPQLDPKYKLKDRERNLEWRTFCACREGEAVLSETLGMWTVSGRSDCDPTAFTNIGFNTLIRDEEVAASVWAELNARVRDKASHYTLSLKEVLTDPSLGRKTFFSIMGNRLGNLMLEGLTRLAHRFPAVLDPDASLIGPTLEGVGWYPANDDTLQVPDIPAWMAGDACGKFRGIVASMISGYYAAGRVNRYVLSRKTTRVLIGGSR
jgi:uncharacterized protein